MKLDYKDAYMNNAYLRHAKKCSMRYTTRSRRTADGIYHEVCNSCGKILNRWMRQDRTIGIPKPKGYSESLANPALLPKAPVIVLRKQVEAHG